MTTVEMFVSLKVPDNVAITALNTIKRIGFKELKGLERSDYYKFDIKDDAKDFKERISNADILVNANKHKYNFKLNNEKFNNFSSIKTISYFLYDEKTNNKKSKNKDSNIKKNNVLVQDLDNGTALLSTLSERLGFDSIKKLEKGVLWTMHFDKKVNGRKIAIDITKNLLMNEHFQRFRLIK